MLDIILLWIIDPLMDFFSHRSSSGRWHFSHLFPVATVACVGIWWLSERWNSIVLLVFGALGTVLFGLFSIVLWIPREIELHKDSKAYFAQKKRRAEELKEQQAENEKKDS